MGIGDREQIEDVGLIEKELKKKIKTLSKEENTKELVSKAFTLGLSYYAVSEDKIPRIDPEMLVEDIFSYRRWQLNIYEDISQQYPGIQWSEVKSAFLKKGLEELER